MPVIKLNYKTSYGAAEFNGALEPVGASGYRFFGTLTASTSLRRDPVGTASAAIGDTSDPLYNPFGSVQTIGRSPDDPEVKPLYNTVRIGHGASSQGRSHLNFTFNTKDTFQVSAQGTRAPNETVDFCIGFNDIGSGDFTDQNKITVTPGGPPQTFTATYVLDNRGAGFKSWNVSFDGTARADGPSGFVIQGQLDVDIPSNSQVTIGYKNTSGGWNYRTYGYPFTDAIINIVGTRNTGEHIQVVIGAASSSGLDWAYGQQVDCALPDQFS